MKEEDAKKKWCPQAAHTKAMTHLVILASIGENRKQIDINKALDEVSNNEITMRSERCIASGCMMWKKEEKVYLLDDGRFIRDCEKINVNTPHEIRDYPESGYGHCGLVK